MKYLHDKKNKSSYLGARPYNRKHFFNVSLVVFLFLIFFYFLTSVFSGLSYITHTMFRPFLSMGGSIGHKFKSTSAYFISKGSLQAENERLKSELDLNNGLMSNYDLILAENLALKEILGRKDERQNLVLGAILSKPNQSPYDTVLVDVGTDHGVYVGAKVFANANIPIGRVIEVYPNSSKVILFSSSGEKTSVSVIAKRSTTLEAGASVEITGRGGGNFEMLMPRDFILEKGDTVVLPGITPYVVAIVEAIVSDPRDAFQKVLLVTPLNIQDLRFVEVER